MLLQTPTACCVNTCKRRVTTVLTCHQSSPPQAPKNNNNTNTVSLVLPVQACELLGPPYMQHLSEVLQLLVNTLQAGGVLLLVLLLLL